MLARKALFSVSLGALMALANPIVGPAQQADSTPPVNVLQNDYAFVIDPTIIPAGPVSFSLLNASEQIPHEMWIYPIDERDTPRFQQMLDLKRTGQRNDEPDFIDGIQGKSGSVLAGEGTTFTISFLPPGVYEVACLARDGIGDQRDVHYDRGMYAALVVRPPS